MKDKPVNLVVDNQLPNTELLEGQPVPQGYEIIRAVNGKDALTIITGNEIDLVLLDIMIPGMKTIELSNMEALLIQYNLSDANTAVNEPYKENRA
jgi:CheY-like chemotaxis protein